jgi:hypothetical protein
MPVTKSHMANGSFSIRFDPASTQPVRTVLDMAAASFDHVVITPSPIDADSTDVATLFDKSIYTGVVFRNDDGLTLEGHHVTSWLGDPGGNGDINERTTAVLTKSFKQWFTYILAAQVSLTGGAIDDIVPATTMDWDPIALLPREMFDYVITFFRTATGNPSIEWLVRDDLGVNGGTAAYLYTETARVMLTPDYAGPDPIVPGIESDLSFSDDVEDYANRQLLYYAGGGGVGVNGTTTTFRDGFNNLVARKRKTTDTEVTAANSTNHATSLIDGYDQIRRQLTATTPRPAIMMDVPCGAYVYAWDQNKGIYDLAIQVPWRGTVASPILTRALEVTMPIEEGLGVYLIRNGTAISDLTRWFIPESPGATLKLESLDRRLVRGRWLQTL